MKLITWNIQWCRGCDGHVDPRRIIEHASRMADFDVLCLQEVAANFGELAGSDGENQFEILASLLPDYTAVAGAAVDMASARGRDRRVFGNMLFSRWPVESVLRHQLPRPADPAHPNMPRMLIEAVLDTPLGRLRVMTTHLEYYSAKQRAAQVEAIRALHAQSCERGRHAAPARKGPFGTRGDPASAILTADFNFKPDDPLWRNIQSSAGMAVPALRDAWTYKYPHKAHPHTIGVHDKKQWPTPYTCDFIFVSEDLLPRVSDVRVDLRSDASDHQPILLVLE